MFESELPPLVTRVNQTYLPKPPATLKQYDEMFEQVEEHVNKALDLLSQLEAHGAIPSSWAKRFTITTARTIMSTVRFLRQNLRKREREEFYAKLEVPGRRRKA